ncbi:ribonuclease H, partial [Trifolium pratense]
MKLMSWNCQGLGNPRTVRALKKLIANNKPDIIFLMETKLHNISPHFKNNFAATYNIYHVDCTLNGNNGKSGGLILLWNTCTCNIEIKDTDFNYIDMHITNLTTAIQWKATGVYGYPQHQNKHLTCDLLKSLHHANHNNNWLLFGDFNLITSDTEKFGGQNTRKKGPKPIRYEQIWTRDNDHYQVVKDTWQTCRGNVSKKLTATLSSLHRWGNNVFGVIPRRIRNLQNELQILNDQNGKINNEMYQELDKVFTKEEVFQAIKDMKALAAPGPDGLPAIFYHTHWEIIGKEVTEMVLNVLNNNGDPSQLNNTYICLIPKIPNPALPNDFRPISLCNVTLKIITKTIANRIKTILPEVISPNQSAFIQGRLITDNTLIASEIFHYLAQTKRKTGYVGIKTDMAKAYDRVEWDFLEATMVTMGFPATMVQTIMKCVTTVKFSILINGYPSQEFYPQRGLRQGDPLSPYLFIICADVLSGLISRAQQEKLIHGIRISQGAPEISHLFFADDSLMFCRATNKEVSTIQDIIQTYQKASGQLVNLTKSEMVFSKGVTNGIKEEISRILPMQISEYFSKYLGMPIVHGRSKQQIFNYIREKIWKKLKGWKEKNLSFAGRGTLIKAVAQAIPTYLMSCFLIPKGVCEQLEKMICNFWWGSTTDQRKMHWLKWSKVCNQKRNGGLGFRDLRAFNEALLAKQGWRLITKPTSLVAQVLKAKYFPNESFLNAKHKQVMSYTWRSIMQASWVIKRGSYWSIGDGEDINIWEDNWMQQKSATYKGRPKPNNLNLIKVKELMDSNYNEWNTDIINQVFLPYEAQMILNIPIIDKTQPDMLTWDCTQDGQYSVKSGYHAIMEWGNLPNASPSNNSQHIWNVLWKLKVPPKHSHLLWRVLHNALPVKNNLFKRGVRCDPLCPRCSNSMETIHHVFLDCEWAKQTWFASALTLNLGQNQLTDFYDWINYMINNTNKECIEKITAIMYGIWYARNVLVFQGKNLPPQEISSTALNQLQEYQTHGLEQHIQDPQVRRNGCSNDISWSPPPRGTLKINVDAHLSSDGHWSTGLVLRRSDGSTVGVATRTHNGSADVVTGEAMGLMDAIEWIEKLGEQSVIFEMDSQVIVKAVKGQSNIFKSWGKVVRRCILFLKGNPSSDIKWVQRKANQAAHEMAKWAEIEPNKEWTTNIPFCIWPVIQKDKGNIPSI